VTKALIDYVQVLSVLDAGEEFNSTSAFSLVLMHHYSSSKFPSLRLAEYLLSNVISSWAMLSSGSAFMLASRFFA
jgi:hypothetical protein